MKVLKTILLSLSCYCFNLQLQAQAIVVDDTKSASDLINLLTNNSSCLQIVNTNVFGDTYTPGKKSYASFTNTNTNFPFQSGIVLSTSTSSQSVGPFVWSQGGGDTSWLGDSDLDQVLNIKSINATYLEFDFIPLTNAISFNFLFASNEYQEDFPCRYSDGFAFLIKEKGSATAYQNLAVIPNTTIPISSTNIHPAISFVDTFGNTKSCAASNESYFGQLNDNPTNTSPINYAGQTKVFSAKTNVIAGNTYHIKLVIGDEAVNYFDSAIFIEAASFNSVIDLGTDKLVATNNAICFGEDYIIDTKLPTNYTYKWYKDNVLLTTETNPTYTVKNAGTYKVEVTLNPSSCTVSNQIKIEYTPETILNNSTLTQCDIDEDGKAIFDLTTADSQIKNNHPNLSAVSYYESLADAKTNNNPILNSSNYTNKSLNQLLIAKVSNAYNCPIYAELTLKISNEVIPERLATITAVKTNNFSGNKNSVRIEYTGIANYEFSIDGNYYQDSPEFSNIAAGNYWAYAREKNGCGISNPFLFYILDYPRFFTPNEDGYNDTWTIKNLNQLPQATIQIFNRYGKLLKQSNSPSFSWNGTLNNYLLPADDYWFSLIFENGQNIKGHFSLKR